MHEIRVSIASPEAADHGVAELWAAGKQIGYTILDAPEEATPGAVRLRADLQRHQAQRTGGPPPALSPLRPRTTGFRYRTPRTRRRSSTSA